MGCKASRHEQVDTGIPPAEVSLGDMRVLPEIPFACIENVAGEGEVCHCMREHALGEAASLIEYDIEDCPGYHPCHDEVVLQPEQHCGDEEGRPGEGS